jgi:hypothetical protein
MATAATTSVSLTSIVNIIQLALTALANLPVVGPDAALADVFVGILQKAMAGYQTASGAPLNLANLPLETPVS